MLQIQSIQQKYEQIEADLRANRDKAKHDITKYLDKEAGVKMDELQTELLKFDAKLKDIHMVSLHLWVNISMEPNESQI